MLRVCMISCHEPVLAVASLYGQLLRVCMISCHESVLLAVASLYDQLLHILMSAWCIYFGGIESLAIPVCTRIQLRL